MSPFHLRVEELRSDRDLSQKALAKKAGLNQSTISRIEAGKTAGVSLGTLEKLAKALGVTPLELLVWTRK